MSEELTGVVEVRVTGRGSRSEMTSVVLVPDGSDGVDGVDGVVLRRRGARALDAEAELAAWAGRRVLVRGTRAFATFVVDAVERA